MALSTFASNVIILVILLILELPCHVFTEALSGDSGVTPVWNLVTTEDFETFVKGDVHEITGISRIFSHGRKDQNLTSCLCGAEPPVSGWCYLGKASNENDLYASHNETSLTLTGQGYARLRCTLYVVVGVSYLYCNPLHQGGAGYCYILQQCLSQIGSLVCNARHECIAWCDTRGRVDLEQETIDSDVIKTLDRTHRSHTMGAGRIAMIAGAAAVCLLVLTCCIVEKARSSICCLLYCGCCRRKKPKLLDDTSSVTVNTPGITIEPYILCKIDSQQQLYSLATPIEKLGEGRVRFSPEDTVIAHTQDISLPPSTIAN